MALADESFEVSILPSAVMDIVRVWMLVCEIPIIRVRIDFQIEEQ